MTSTSDHRTARVVFVLLLAHLIWGLARVPGRVWGKRLGEISDYRELGAASFHLDSRHLQGAAEVERIVAETPDTAVVLWRGEWKGALEFVPFLIAPRLLVAEDAVRPGESAYRGRPLARLERGDGSAAVIVLEGLPARLEIHFR